MEDKLKEMYGNMKASGSSKMMSQERDAFVTYEIEEDSGIFSIMTRFYNSSVLLRDCYDLTDFSQKESVMLLT